MSSVSVSSVSDTPSILLTFLGVGDYKRTVYTWNGDQHETRYIAEALQHFVSPAQTLVVMTPEAEERHAGALDNRCDFEPVRVPSGGEDTAWWTMFMQIAEAVPDAGRLTVDVTHGFRTQPLLALAVVLYLRAVKDIALEHLVYGAYEARDGATDRTAIIDISAVVDLIDWATAVRRFTEHGDARPMRDMFASVAQASRSGDRVALNVGPAGQQLARLTRALTVNRPLEAIEEGNGLIPALEGAMEESYDVSQARPVRRLMLAAAQHFAPIGHAEGHKFTSAGFAAQAAMLRFYRETEQYLQGVTLAREMLISWVCREHDLDLLRRGGREGPGREHGKRMLQDWSRAQDEDPEQWEELGSHEQKVARLWEAVRELRNDLAHAGFQHHRSSTEEVIQQARSTLAKVASFFQE